MSFTGFYKVKNEYRPVRFVAMKKSEKDYEKAVRKIENDCRRKNRSSPKQDTLELNKYIILVTNLNYSDDKILELYRYRWQIELVFKRLKSLFELSKIPSAKSKTAEAWFYGKLFLAVLCETIFKAEVFSPKKKKKILKNRFKKLKYIPLISASFWNSLHIILIYVTFLILDSLDFSLLVFKWQKLLKFTSNSKRSRKYSLFRIFSLK